MNSGHLDKVKKLLRLRPEAADILIPIIARLTVSLAAYAQD